MSNGQSLGDRLQDLLVTKSFSREEAPKLEAVLEEVAALEELAEAATAWRYSHPGSREMFRSGAQMVAALERLESMRSQR